MPHSTIILGCKQNHTPMLVFLNKDEYINARLTILGGVTSKQ